MCTYIGLNFGIDKNVKQQQARPAAPGQAASTIAQSEQFDAEDITRGTIPEDFARNPKIHVCYVLRPKGRVLANA